MMKEIFDWAKQADFFDWLAFFLFDYLAVGLVRYVVSPLVPADESKEIELAKHGIVKQNGEWRKL